jgi:transcriptional regulator with XRE-family HTH domain
MNTAPNETEATLSSMRDAKGLSLSEVGKRLGEALDRAPYTHARILQIENDGTDSNRIIEALAVIYDQPVEIVRTIAANLYRSSK